MSEKFSEILHQERDNIDALVRRSHEYQLEIEARAEDERVRILEIQNTAKHVAGLLLESNIAPDFKVSEINFRRQRWPRKEYEAIISRSYSGWRILRYEDSGYDGSTYQTFGLILQENGNILRYSGGGHKNSNHEKYPDLIVSQWDKENSEEKNYDLIRCLAWLVIHKIERKK